MTDLAHPCAHVTPTLADTGPTRILAALTTLTLGAVAYFSGVRVHRVSLLTYVVAGFYLDQADAPAEIAYLAAERAAIQDEPSLYTAAEIVARRLLVSRGIEGAFTVRIERLPHGPVYVATWHSPDYHTTPDDDRTALDDLAAWAVSMGLSASRVGFEVVAPVHGSVPARPPLAKTKTDPARRGTSMRAA
jgi:hypothetical protein